MDHSRIWHDVTTSVQYAGQSRLDVRRAQFDAVHGLSAGNGLLGIVPIYQSAPPIMHRTRCSHQV